MRGVEPRVETDRFGNRFAPGLPYARGQILTSTEDDVRKVRRAGRVIERRLRDHGPASVFNFSGLERGLPLEPKDLAFADDEIAPALYFDRFRALALAHLGGNPETHDARLFNRVTAAVTATHLALVRPGDVVVGISAGYSHPSVVRAAALAGATFLDTTSVPMFADTLEREPAVGLVALTRLAVTYDILPADDIRRIVRLAREKGAVIYVDDAGGARVGPAAFDQPRMLDLGVDVGATGLDKYGTVGPRLGLLAGEQGLVARIYARALEFGLEARPMLYPAAVRSLEQYAPARVAALVETTKRVATALRARLGSRVHETPVTAQLRADDVLELAMERGRVSRPPVVPVEATAALAMLLLEDYGILTVHFAGLPPGTSSLLFKFIPPETLARFGGAEALAQAVDHSLSKLGGYLREPDGIRSLLLDGA
jgi:L-seryl-tRNA(Ser) seleniumtransferase